MAERMEATTPESTVAGSSPAYMNYISTRIIVGLNGVRFLAISAVLWHHFPIRENLSQGHILKYGFLGVDLFFVLSGYLITTIILREMRVTGTFSLRAFYWRRALRIIPAYYFLVLTVGIYYIFIDGQLQYLEIWPYYFLFLANFIPDDIPILGIAWSLSVEEQFYTLWPLALLLFSTRWIILGLVALIILNLAAVMGLLAPLGVRAFNLGPLVIAMHSATFAPILMGALLALLLNHPAGFAGARAVLGARLMAPLLLVAIIVVTSAMPAVIVGLPTLAIHITMTAFITAVVCRPDNALTPMLSWAPINRIGEISYGIYLYHLIALDIAYRLSFAAGVESLFAVALLYLALSYVMADISFRTLESWFQRQRDLRVPR